MKDPDYMEMPCPCRRCGAWFDLNDGHTSEKWYPNTIICEECGEIEEKEIELEEEIRDMEERIEDAMYTVRSLTPELKKLRKKLKDLQQ